jgi:uncharacterized protein (TIGR04255 family)
MSADENQVGFKPIHDAHAIEQLIATIQFSKELSADQFRAANRVMADFENTLPVRNEIRGFGIGFSINPGGIAPIPTTGNDIPSGIVRGKMDERGVQIKEVRLDRQQIMFRTQAYTRWNAVWGEAQEYFSKILGSLDDYEVVSYGLAYVDKFIWSGPSADCRGSYLLRQGSAYITPRSLDTADLWHCHTGRFARIDNVIKRLETIDLDCVDEPHPQLGFGADPLRVVRITSNVVDLLNQHGFDPVTLGGNEFLQQFRAKFDALHNVQRSLTLEILNDDSAARIGLTKNAA